MTPARSLSATARIFEPLSLQMPAERPYGVLLAFAIASAGVRKVSTESTGPKISSRAIVDDVVTPVKIVGANQNPFSGMSHGALQRSAPSRSPMSLRVRMRSSCSAELIAPMSVFLSSGSPRRRVMRRCFRRSTTSSWMFSCTSRRLPAQHTWPWLKKMPLTMPSTAWSMGASSKTMLAALPPSSRVAFLRVPAIAFAISRPTPVEPVNATLSTSGCRTSAWPVSPAPVTMLTTPGGRSACCRISANSSADSGVVSAGFSTTVLPAARAGAIFHASMSSGKFHGMIWAATPCARGFAPRPA